MKRQSGFTIVEVALVLAIAGLIFLMAFLALPSLWASQRDADRKARVMELVSDIKTYQTNNSRGALPVLSGSGPEEFTWADTRPTFADSTTWKAFIHDYVSADFADASGNDYEFYVVKCLAADGRDLATGEACAYRSSDFGEINNPENVNIGGGVDYKMYIAVGATCDGDHAVKTNSSRGVAVVQILERAGRHCYNT